MPVSPHPPRPSWCILSRPRGPRAQNCRKTSRNHRKTARRGPKAPRPAPFQNGLGRRFQECNHRHYNGLDPRARRQTPSRVWPSLARPRQRESVRRSPRSANVAQVARNNGPAAASCPSPIGPRPTLGRCRCRPRQQPSSPPTVLDGRACRYAVTTRRALAVRGRHPAPASPQAGGSLLFAERGTPAGDEHRSHVRGAHRRNQPAVARSLSCPGSAALLRHRGPLRMLWRMCCGAAAEKPSKIKAVAVLRFHMGERPSAKGWPGRAISPADVRPASRSPRLCNFDGGPRRDPTELASHSSGIPALRRPTSQVASNRARIFGTKCTRRARNRARLE